MDDNDERSQAMRRRDLALRILDEAEFSRVDVRYSYKSQGLAKW
jgi:hypothetical protein